MRISDSSSDVCSSDLEFGESPFRPLRPGIEGQRPLHRHRLPHGPQLQTVRPPLALRIVGILVMMRLHRGKKVQFEGNARMPRRHDPMVDKLPLAPAAEMAVETDRKSTRLNSSTNAHLVCRLLLEKKKTTTTQKR